MNMRERVYVCVCVCVCVYMCVCMCVCVAPINSCMSQELAKMRLQFVY